MAAASSAQQALSSSALPLGSVATACTNRFVAETVTCSVGRMLLPCSSSSVLRLPAEGNGARTCVEWQERPLSQCGTGTAAYRPVRGFLEASCQCVPRLEPSCTTLSTGGDRSALAVGGPCRGQHSGQLVGGQHSGQLVGVALRPGDSWGTGRMARVRSEECRHEWGRTRMEEPQEQPWPQRPNIQPHDPWISREIHWERWLPASLSRTEAKRGAQAGFWRALPDANEVGTKEGVRTLAVHGRTRSPAAAKAGVLPLAVHGRARTEARRDPEAEEGAGKGAGLGVTEGATTWVPVVQAAACCSSRKECMHLLRSMAAAGYDLPVRTPGCGGCMSALCPEMESECFQAWPSSSPECCSGLQLVVQVHGALVLVQRWLASPVVCAAQIAPSGIPVGDGRGGSERRSVGGLAAPAQKLLWR